MAAKLGTSTVVLKDYSMAEKREQRLELRTVSSMVGTKAGL